ncbi:MAG: hypothetical protein SF339_13310 [Blastocatellia bacterium]|nr:hypothetical protein [Blastocatellia bacterium]
MAGRTGNRQPATDYFFFIMRKPIFVFTIFAVLFFALAAYSGGRKSATNDETAHIAAGYAALKTGDYRLNPEHPPLIKLLSGVPLLLRGAKLDLGDASWRAVGTGKMGWRHIEQWYFGAKFLYEWNDADRTVFWARAPIILLSIGLAGLVGWWAWSLYGWRAGCLALGLYLTTPDLLAHSQLVTTDLGVTCFFFLAVFGFWRALHSLTPGNLVMACVGTGCLLAAKFSGPLIFPIFAALAVIFAYSDEKADPAMLRARLGEIGTFRSKLLLAGALMAACALTGLLVIWACYRFRHRISPDAAVSGTIDWMRYWAKDGLVNNLMQAFQEWRLLPEGYVLGFFDAFESLERRPAFLLGEISETGWWYYFPVSFLIKTPLPLIALIVAGGVAIRRFGAGLVNELALLTPAAIYLAVAMAGNINIGNRHILPIYPFLIVAASKIARVFEPGRAKWMAAACGLLLAWNAVEIARVYPHDLAYFNQIAGGPAGGYRWLVDSNLDWGQDLKELARYRREHPEEPFYLAYFGTASPEYYGIRAKHLPSVNIEAFRNPGGFARFSDVQSGAIVAVSATSLQCVLLNDQRAKGVERFMAGLRELTPIARIGHSIFVFRMP